MRHRWVRDRQEYTTNTPYYRVLPFRSENRPASLSTFAGSVTDEARLPFDPALGFFYKGMPDSCSHITCCSPWNQRQRYHMLNLYVEVFFFRCYILHFTNRTMRHERTASATDSLGVSSTPECSCFSVSLTPFCSAESATCPPFEKRSIRPR